MSKQYIASVLKRLRLQSGLTADEVGKMVGKSGKTVNGWENARSQPDADMLLKLCDIYAVDDILHEFNGIKATINNEQLLLTAHEKKVVVAYREKPDMQSAVDKLLGVDDDEDVLVLRAARSENNKPVEYIAIPKEKMEQLKNASSVEDDVDL